MNEHFVPNTPAPVRIIALAGSLREKSYTRRAVEIAVEGARDVQADAMLIDLRQLKLPFCTGEGTAAEAYPDVGRLRHEVRSAQGVILGSPEYHGSFSGVLKNALDLTDLEDWQGKVIALIGVSGGSAGPGSALVGLRTVGRGLAAWVLPSQVSIASVHKAFDESGQPHSPDVVKRLKQLGGELAYYARLHAEDRRAK
jgi:NAD(P)H-dependent FMN reductase